ncbi:unnamed protein product [Ectocarpus sp. CCAP 1310/34]|nr:unnamed protein product [Ectocarpus sp. CCAP 1310/34]
MQAHHPIAQVLEQYVLTDIKTKMGIPAYTSATRATPTTTVAVPSPCARLFPKSRLLRRAAAVKKLGRHQRHVLGELHTIRLGIRWADPLHREY